MHAHCALRSTFTLLPIFTSISSSFYIYFKMFDMSSQSDDDEETSFSDSCRLRLEEILNEVKIKSTFNYGELFRVLQIKDILFLPLARDMTVGNLLKKINDKNSNKIRIYCRRLDSLCYVEPVDDRESFL